jgi:hypothetical protein
MSAQNKAGFPTLAITDGTAAAERREREAEFAKDDAVIAREGELEAAQRALVDRIEPRDRREKRPMRQISIMVSQREHENLTANARDLGVTLRTLIARTLKPATERIKIRKE